MGCYAHHGRVTDDTGRAGVGGGRATEGSRGREAMTPGPQTAWGSGGWCCLLGLGSDGCGIGFRVGSTITQAGAGAPYYGPGLGSWGTLGNQLSEQTHGVRDKAEVLVGKGHLGGGRQSQGDPGEVLGPVVSPVPGWLLEGGVGFPGRLRSVIFLVPRCGLRPFLVAHTSLRQDPFQRECFWEVGRT